MDALRWELARPQLIPVDAVPDARDHPPHLFADMAGNAFNGGSFLCALIALLAELPLLVKCTDTSGSDQELLQSVADMVQGLD